MLVYQRVYIYIYIYTYKCHYIYVRYYVDILRSY